jgi:hypothetical protein
MKLEIINNIIEKITSLIGVELRADSIKYDIKTGTIILQNPKIKIGGKNEPNNIQA